MRAIGKKLKQEIGQLSVDNLNITIADIVPHDSARSLGVRVLEKTAKAHTVYEVHHDKRA